MRLQPRVALRASLLSKVNGSLPSDHIAVIHAPNQIRSSGSGHKEIMILTGYPVPLAQIAGSR